jgi:hypothetical protein
MVESVQEKKGQSRLNLAPNFGAKLSFMPRWSPVYFVFLFFLKSHLVPYVTKTVGSGAVFAGLYG